MIGRRAVLYLMIMSSLIAGLYTGQSFFFNIAFLFGGILVLAFIWSALAVRWIRVGRRTRSRKEQVGKMLDETFMVANLAYIPKLWLEIRDYSDLPSHRASHVVPAVGPRGRYTWHVQTLCLSRGEFHLGPISVTSGDPFGLFLSTRKVAKTESVIVYPAIASINKFDSPMGALSGGEAQRQRTHNVTTNAVGVREYVYGDSLNRVHWRTTARRDKLMVKEFELDPLVDVYIIVDFSVYSLYEAASVQRLHGDGPVIPTSQHAPASTEEYSVIIAATLCSYFTTLNRALGFVAYTPAREVHEAERGERQLNRVLQTLATARSKSPYTLAQMLTLEAPYLQRGATLIIITPSTATDWIAETQILARRGIHPMCIFVDPHSFGSSVRTDDLKDSLRVAKIPFIPVHYYDDITAALEQRMHV
ncbi:MAG: DUF58 domain-containing protein [Chloroflexota bacterium]